MERDTATSHPPLLGIAIFCPQKLGSQNNIQMKNKSSTTREYTTCGALR